MTNYNAIVEAMNNIVRNWGEKGKTVIACAFEEHKEITMKDFFNNCTAFGGDWVSMFLSGIKVLYPKTYQAIPNDMGDFAAILISYVLFLCGVS